MSTRSTLLKVVLPILILAVGVVGMRVLVGSKQVPAKLERRSPGALVEVMTVAPADHEVTVYATGTVVAAQEAAITPEVTGRVVWLAPNLVAGGFFHAGEPLFEIEATDYRLAVERARAAVAKGSLDLATVESQAAVARREWQNLKSGDGAPPHPLVVYEPQVANAQANLAAAKAALEQAELDLKRTRVVAPFDCRVRSETVDQGQYLRAGVEVARIAGTARAEVVVPLPLEELRHLRVPRPTEAGKSGAVGSPATLILTVDDQQYRWSGRVVRSLGEVDPAGRMARVVAAVDDPYGLHGAGSDGRPELALGLFVAVELHGATLPGVFPIPRSALRPGETVWLVDDAGQLQIRPVEVARREREQVCISQGLTAGDRVVLTALSGAANGMALRPVEVEPPPAITGTDEVKG
jgi:RND family efflux transporter MFP subunit